MKRVLTTSLAIAGVSVAGCSTTGLSPRETCGRTQPALLYSMYDNVGAGDAAFGPARPLRLPASVAVVQVGEVAPPQPMMDALRKEPAVFSRIEALPAAQAFAAYDVHRGHHHHHHHQNGVAPQPPRPELGAMRRLAADLGMDYLLLVGGSIDHDNSGTPLSLLDLTIVGAFAVPSRETRGTAKASAALMDVRSGRVVVNSSAEARRRSFVPSASVQGEETKLLERLRDDVVAKLGTQVLADTKTRAAFGNGAAAASLPDPLATPTAQTPAPASAGAGWDTLPAGARYQTAERPITP